MLGSGGTPFSFLMPRSVDFGLYHSLLDLNVPRARDVRLLLSLLQVRNVYKLDKSFYRLDTSLYMLDMPFYRLDESFYRLDKSFYRLGRSHDGRGWGGRGSRLSPFYRLAVPSTGYTSPSTG